MRFHRTLFLLISLALGARSLAQQANVEFKMSTTTIEVGESVDAQLICTNTAQPETPKLAGSDGVSIVLTNPNPSQASFMSIGPSGRTQQVKFTYPVRVTGKMEGTYALGPFTVTAGGQAHQSNTVKLQVKPASVQNKPDGDRVIFSSIAVDTRTVYITESFTATLKIFIRRVERNGRPVEFDLLRNVLDQRSSDLSDFGGSDVRASETTIRDSQGRQHRYVVYTATKVLRAETAGAFEVGPVFLKANYPTELRANFFGGFDVVSAKVETARTEALTVEVKAPPEANRPDDYNGAIGKFTLDVTAKPDKLELGQAVTLTVNIRGNPLEGIAGPLLTRNAELTSRFEFAQDELSGDIEGDAKVFRRAIFPRQIGEQSVPTISWSYFDTKTERYVSLSSNPIPIVVEPSTNVDVPSSFSSRDGELHEETELTVLAGGIAPIYEDATSVLVDQQFRFSTGWMAAVAGSPVLCGLLTLLARHQARLRGDRGYARRRKAVHRAMSLVSRAERETGAKQLETLGVALRSYLADRFDLALGAVTTLEARELLGQVGMDKSTVEQVADFLGACDEVRYAPTAARSGDNGESSHVRDWIRAMEKVRS